MHVRTFEADTLDEALKAIKKELGPEAIIISSTTNKGIKGAFKKKVKITATITEDSYKKKVNVDKVLNKEQKEAFYKDKSENIKKSIDKYAEGSQKINSYNKLALNRAVKTTTNESPDDKQSKKGESLDAFLNESGSEAKEETILEKPLTNIDQGSHEENVLLREELRLQKISFKIWKRS